ncbi:hypothetical protein IE53DRAFT_387119 [Violaceomyces palustris]|uniref:Uncharacterized protein n=1 Tax=Violaceomyces palustris TaxID=1673888 RepID=A0ACD0NXF7_9BASI|nr:hypothetical protein IE53DRAFT_387119 [Violaceomyces palustris]
MGKASMEVEKEESISPIIAADSEEMVKAMGQGVGMAQVRGGGGGGGDGKGSEDQAKQREGDLVDDQGHHRGETKNPARNKGKGWWWWRGSGKGKAERLYPTLFFRSLIIILAELVVNLLIWIVTVIVFTSKGRGGDDQTKSLAAHRLGLCLLAWTIGLRHGLDADHISAIDNATRRIVALRHPSPEQFDGDLEEVEDDEIDGKGARKGEEKEEATDQVELEKGGGVSKDEVADRSKDATTSTLPILASSSPSHRNGRVDQVESRGRPRRPVTVGLFFSLGHSTIVLSVLIAIAISTSVIDRLGGVSDVGGVIGTAVSGSFLFLIGIINSFLLYSSWSKNRRRRLNPPGHQRQDSPSRLGDGEGERSEQKGESGDGGVEGGKEELGGKGKGERLGEMDGEAGRKHFKGITTRFAMPLLKLVDRPYKMYPVGVLFGLGFDTAGSIALLGVAAAASSSSSSSDDVDAGKGKSDAAIVLLALLFTAGMTLVDSLDSVLMVHAYAPDAWNRRSKPGHDHVTNSTGQGGKAWWRHGRFALLQTEREQDGQAIRFDDGGVGKKELESNKKDKAINLSHLLTLLSIILALAISIIELVGLVGDQCSRCSSAADRQESYEALDPSERKKQASEGGDGGGGGGLEGRWWLFWRKANDQSGLIGAGIVGTFLFLLLAWYASRYIAKRRARSKARRSMSDE